MLQQDIMMKKLFFIFIIALYSVVTSAMEPTDDSLEMTEGKVQGYPSVPILVQDTSKWCSRYKAAHEEYNSILKITGEYEIEIDGIKINWNRAEYNGEQITFRKKDGSIISVLYDPAYVDILAENGL